MHKVIIGVTVLVAALLLQTPGAEAAEACPFIAHRGGISGTMTENSMGRIKAAYATNVMDFEVDVRTSKSGTLVIMHDPTLKRTTNGTGYVKDRGRKYLHSIRLNDGQPIPYVNNVLRYASAHGMHPVLHIKSMTSASWTRLMSVIDRYEYSEETTIMGHDAQMATAHRLNPVVSTVVIDLYQTVAPSRLVNRDGAAVPYGKVTQDSIDAVHAAGKTYWVFTPNKSTDWDKLAGVDNMFVDTVAERRAYCDSAANPANS